MKTSNQQNADIGNENQENDQPVKAASGQNQQASSKPEHLPGNKPEPHESPDNKPEPRGAPDKSRDAPEPHSKDTGKTGQGAGNQQRS